MMVALAKAISRLTRTDLEIEPLKAIIIFCGLGLLVSLVCAMAYGLDLSSAP